MAFGCDDLYQEGLENGNPLRGDFNLRPCPFCGGKAVFWVNASSQCAGSVAIDFDIKCLNCHAEAPVHIPQVVKFRLNENGEIEIIEDDRQYIADIWNGSNLKEIKNE